MEQPGAHVARPDNGDVTENPNHLIIWLDKHIGKTGECALLKRAFFMTADPATGYDVSLHEEDIDNSMRSGEAVPVRLDGIQFTLRTFEDPTICYEAIKNNLDKRIFFISSGTKGEVIVPQLVANFPKIFVEDKPIYIFCGNMNMMETARGAGPAHDWVWDYTDHVVMYDHQDDLLARIVLDIAKYFFAEAERLDEAAQLDKALQHYKWSKKMFERSEKAANRPNLMKASITKTDQRIADIEQRLNS